MDQPRQYTSEKYTPMILAIVVSLSVLSAIGYFFKVGFVTFLHVLQILTPLAANFFIWRRGNFKKPMLQIMIAFVLLPIGDAFYYFEFYVQKISTQSMDSEIIATIPYLVAYCVMIYGLYPLIKSIVKHFSWRLICLLSLVPMSLWLPTFKEILVSGGTVDWLEGIQTVVNIGFMIVGCLIFTTVRERTWNTLGLGIICIGLAELSIMVEHLFRTVAIPSINTYIWTMAVMIVSLPGIIGNFSNEPSLSAQDGFVVKARSWLFLGIVVPVAFFSFLGRGDQIMAFTALTVLMATTVIYIMTNEFFASLEDTRAILDALGRGDLVDREIERVPSEIRSEIVRVFERQLELNVERQNQELIRAKEMESVARSVVHDIRSPLSALNMVLFSSNTFPEDTRTLIRRAVQRIEDIASNLLKQHLLRDDPAELTSVQIANSHQVISTVESIVSEKRVQYQGRENLEIRFESNESVYGLFARYVPSDLKRVISNIIDNSIDAIREESGEIVISLAQMSDEIRIRISDNGCGIPAHVLSRVGEKGFSFGKSGIKVGGSGIGLYHAKELLGKWGGRLEVRSEPGEGTTVSVFLSRSEAPSWFVEKLVVDEGVRIAVIDDDTSIHDVWDWRFSDRKQQSKVQHFSSPYEFQDWSSSNEADVYLVDFEFVGSQMNGLELIERNNLGKKAILVTSLVDDGWIADQCAEKGIGLIPKGLVPILPISEL